MVAAQLASKKDPVPCSLMDVFRWLARTFCFPIGSTSIVCIMPLGFRCIFSFSRASCTFDWLEMTINLIIWSL